MALMKQKIIFIGIPALVLAIYLLTFIWSSVFPLTAVGDWYGNHPSDHPGESLLLASIPLYYLVAYGLLCFMPKLAPWLKAIISLVLAGVICALCFADLLAQGFGVRRGPPPFLKPFELLGEVTTSISAPLRFQHYLRNFNSHNKRYRNIARLEVRWAGGGEARGKGDAHLQHLVTQAFRAETDERERHNLATTLATTQPVAASVIRELAEGLKATDPSVRKDTAALLARLRTAEPAILSTLVEAVNNDVAIEVRCQAALALSALAPNDPRLEQALLHAIDKGEPFGAKVLFNINPHDPRVIDAFARFLRATTPEVHCAWMNAIVNVENHGDADAEDVVPPNGVRLSIVEVLKDADTHQMDLRSLLARGVKDRNAKVRTGAVEALDRAYAEDPAVELLLAPMLQDPDEDVRRAAVYALDETSSTHPSEEPRRHSRKVTLALVRALADPSIASLAVRALSEMRLQDFDIQAAILTMLREGKAKASDVREALKNSKLDNPAIRQQIAALLRQPDADVARCAAELLQEGTAADAEVDRVDVDDR